MVSLVFHFVYILTWIHVSLENEVPQCVTKVSKCPENNILWINKEKQLECKNSNKIYTCMMYQTAHLVEMCLIDYNILNGTDGCPFIIACKDGKPVPALKNRLCEDESIGCPPKFHGGFPVSKLYQYPACLNMTKHSNIEFSSSTQTLPSAEFTRSNITIKQMDVLIYVLPILTTVMMIVYVLEVLRLKRKKKKDSRKKKKDLDILSDHSIFIVPLQSYSMDDKKIIASDLEVLNRLEIIPAECNPYFIFYCDDSSDTIEVQKAAYAVVSSRRPHSDISRIISKEKIPQKYFRTKDMLPCCFTSEADPDHGRKADLLKWMNKNKMTTQPIIYEDAERTGLNEYQRKALLPGDNLEQDRNENEQLLLREVAEVVLESPPRFLSVLDPLIISIIYNNETSYDLFWDQVEEEKRKMYLKQAYCIRSTSKNIKEKIMKEILLVAKSEMKHIDMSLRYSKREDKYLILGYSKDTSLTNPVKTTFCAMDLEIRNEQIQMENRRKHSTGSRYYSKNDFPIDSTSKQLFNAKSCIEEWSPVLWTSHSNLVGVTSQITGKGIYDFLIILVCSGKGLIPIGEKVFPNERMINGHKIRISVMEGYFSFTGTYGNPTGFNEMLCMGCNIGLEDLEDKSGSLGLFIESQGSLKCITTCHTLYDDSDLCSAKTNIGTNVIQPSGSDLHCNKSSKDRVIGRVVKAVFNIGNEHGDRVSVDAALVNIDDRKPKKGLFAVRDQLQLENAGYSRKDPPIYNSGEYINDLQSEEARKVIKSGSATGLTMGYIGMDGIQIRVDKKLYSPNELGSIKILKGQYEIRDINDVFSQAGDSGSAVFLKTTTDQLKCLGIVVGYLRTCRYGWSTIVTPITAVLKELELQPSNIKKFEEHHEKKD